MVGWYVDGRRSEESISDPIPGKWVVKTPCSCQFSIDILAVRLIL
jgi:hypothetical protein